MRGFAELLYEMTLETRDSLCFVERPVFMPCCLGPTQVLNQQGMHGLFNNFGQLKLNYSITSAPSLDTWRQPWKTGNKVKVPPDYSIQVNKDSIEIRGEDAQCLQFVALWDSCLPTRLSSVQVPVELLMHWGEQRH